MKRMTSLLIVPVVLLMAAAPLTVEAAGKKAKSEVVMKMGDKVHLFHSSKVEVQKDISIGDVLLVYRQVGGKDVQPNEVGAVKVLSFIGSHYFEAQIVKGQVKVGDIATKDQTSLLVQPAR
jgi:hypothetical protein